MTLTLRRQAVSNSYQSSGTTFQSTTGKYETARRSLGDFAGRVFDLSENNMRGLIVRDEVGHRRMQNNGDICG